MENQLLSPKSDFVLKELMTNQKVLKGFLSAVLKIPVDEILEAVLTNTNLRKLSKEDKQGVLDVRVTLNNNIEIDIEVQVAPVKVWAERSLFYLAKMFTDQIREAQKYDVFKKCINISILNFKLFKDTDEFYSCFHLREDERHSLYTDKFEFHIIELPKLPKDINNDDLLCWSKFINAESEEEFNMIATKNPYINEALEELKKISQDDEKRNEYWAREKALRDYIYFASEAEEAQKQKEEAQKQKEEAQKQKEEAQKQAERFMHENETLQQEKFKTIQNLLDLNFSVEDVAKIVNSTVEEIEKTNLLKKS